MSSGALAGLKVIDVSTLFAGPLAAGDAPQLAELLYETYRYQTGPVADFLAALDTP